MDDGDDIRIGPVYFGGFAFIQARNGEWLLVEPATLDVDFD